MPTILDHAKDTLLLGGVNVIETRDIPHGWQLRGSGGEVVNLYTTGKAVAQGKIAAKVKSLFDAKPLPKPGAVAKPRVVAPVEKAGAASEDGDFTPRYPPGWSWEPWDGVTVPF